MWCIFDKGREFLRVQLVGLLGSSLEEVAINWNVLEVFEIVIFGLQLKVGDEVVLSKYDYFNMMNVWKQWAYWDGVVFKWVDLDLLMEEESVIVECYISQFMDKICVVYLMYMINWNGQVLLVCVIVEQAWVRGIDVMVDVVYFFVYLDFKVEELQCDYLGISLYKWFCVFFGSGLFYVC